MEHMMINVNARPEIPLHDIVRMRLIAETGDQEAFSDLLESPALDSDTAR